MSPMRAALRSITPLIPSGGPLGEALRFYREQMGFSVVWEAGGMAGIARDSVAFLLVENDNRRVPALLRRRLRSGRRLRNAQT